MPQYLVAIHHPDNYAPSAEGEAMVRDIDVLNEEMEAAGARFFAGGLQSAPHAKSLRKQPVGKVLITDGPYIVSEYLPFFRADNAQTGHWHLPTHRTERQTNLDHGPELTSPGRSHKVPGFNSNFFSRTVRIDVTAGMNSDIWSSSANIAS